jgi:hypothetical protein
MQAGELAPRLPPGGGQPVRTLNIADVAKLQRKHDPVGNIVECIGQPSSPPHPLSRSYGWFGKRFWL